LRESLKVTLVVWEQRSAVRIGDRNLDQTFVLFLLMVFIAAEKLARAFDTVQRSNEIASALGNMFVTACVLW
jgi:hypothetical protein